MKIKFSRILSLTLAILMMASVMICYPITASAATLVNSCVDNITTQVNGGAVIPFGQLPEVNDFNAAVTVIGAQGWAGFSAAINQFGYYFDGNTETAVFDAAYTSAFANANDQAAVQGVGGVYAQRFNIQAPMNTLTTGDHTITYAAKLSDGSIMGIYTLALNNVTGKTPVVPSPEEPEVDDGSSYSIDFSKPTATPATDFGIGTNNVQIGSNTFGGFLTFTATGSDPYVTLATDSTAIMENMDYVVIKYRTTSTDAYGELYCGANWGKTKSWAWSNTFETYESEWKIARINFSSIWGSNTGVMKNLRFDILSDDSGDTTDFSGQSIDVAYIKFFATKALSKTFIESDRTSETTTTTTSQEFDASNVITVGGQYYHYDTLKPLSSSVVSSTPKYATGDAQHNMDFWMGYMNGTFYNTPASEFVNWSEVNLGNTGYWSNAIGFYGWVNTAAAEAGGSLSKAINAVGYQVDNGEIVWIDGTTSVASYLNGTTTAVEKDTALQNAIGSKARRYTIWVPVSEFSLNQVHSLYLYAKTANDDIICLNEGWAGGVKKGIRVNMGAAADYVDANGNPYTASSAGFVKDDNGNAYITTGGIAVTDLGNGKFGAVTTTTTTTLRVNTPVGLTATLNSASVRLGEALALKITATLPTLSLGDYVWALQAVMNDDVTIIPLNTANLVSGNKYYFNFDGITPQSMGDDIDLAIVVYDPATETVMITADTHEDYSIKQALTNLLTKYATDTALVQLVSDVLVYGAAAQTYVGYRTDSLVTDGLTLYPSSALPTAADDVLSLQASSGTAKFHSAGVLYDKGFIKLNVKLVIPNASNVTVRVNGVAAELISKGNNGYVLYTDHIAAMEHDNIFTFELIENGTVVQTLRYSVNTYAARMYNKVDTNGNPTANARLALALYRYGASAEAYAS